MKVTVEQMRAFDKYTIENFTESKVLMQRAAQGIFDSADFKNKKTAIVCGGGNNGGDGYALSLILKESGETPVIFRVSEKLSQDGKYFCDKAESEGIEICDFNEETCFNDFDIVVDCIFGTGFSGEPQGKAAEAINKINASGAFVISADINSGLNGNTGEAFIAVKSNLTVSIGFYKIGMFKGNASLYIENMVNVDIGIVPDPSFLKDEN